MAPWLLALIALADFHESGHSLKVTASDNDLRLNEALIIEVQASPPLEDMVVFDLERALATQKSSGGLLDFFLASTIKGSEGIRFTLLPQFPGHFTLQLPSISIVDKKVEIPLFSLSVEAFPAYDEVIGPAPKMPLEPQDPLEIDEANRRKLKLINQSGSAQSVLKERTIPPSNWVALILGIGLTYLIYVLSKAPTAPVRDRRILKEEAIERFEIIKTLPKKQGADALYHLLIRFTDKQLMPSFVPKLNQWRFQQEEPADAEWEAILLDTENYLRR